MKRKLRLLLALNWRLVFLALLVLAALPGTHARALSGDTVADRVFGQAGIFTSASCNMGGSPNASTLCGNSGMAFDAAGHLYVADYSNNRVLEYDNPLMSQTASIIFGQSSPSANACNMGGSPSAITLCHPNSVAVDGAGHLYISDAGNNRVLEYNTPLTSQTANLVFGQGGSPGTNTCNLGGSPSASNLCGPESPAFDSAGRLYIADTVNSRVLEYDSPLTSQVANHVIGQGSNVNFTSGTCNMGSSPSAGTLCMYDGANSGGGVAADATGHLYVADWGNNRALEYDNPLAATPTANRVFGQGGSFTSNTCNNGGVSASSLCGSQTLTVDPQGRLYINDLYRDACCGSINNRVLEYDSPLTSQTATQVFGQGGNFTTNSCNLGGPPSSSSLCGPNATAFDQRGDVYIADDNNNRILEYDRPVSPSLSPTAIMEFPIPTASSLPSDITPGPDGNLWFTEYSTGANKIARITPAGAVTEYPIPTANDQPLGITAGPDGNLWFAERGGNKIGVITTAGAITEFAVPTPNSQPYGIRAGPDGNLWFTEYNANNVARITTAGVVTEFAIPTVGSGPQGITPGPDGNLWFTEHGSSKIGEITTTGVISEFATPTASSAPFDIISGPDGNLWFTEFTDRIGKITTSGAITEFPAPTNSGPGGIAAGPDGNLWFTEYNANNVARIAPAGAVTEFAVPTAASGADLMATGPDGNIWFVERNQSKIGKVSGLGPAPAPGPSLPLTAIARQGQSSPIPGAAFVSFGPASSMNATGDIAFWAQVTGPVGQGIFKSSGGVITKLVAIGDSTPLGGTFATLTPVPVMNTSGDVAFWASVTGGSAAEGVFKWSGGVITKIVAVGDPTPAGGTYTTFSPPAPFGVPVINDAGDVSFWAGFSPANQGVFLYTGGTVKKVAINGDATPAGGTFSSFTDPLGHATVAIPNNLHQVSFWGAITGAAPTQGDFLYDSGSSTLSKVVANGDVTPLGGTFGFLSSTASVNDSGQVAFLATLVGPSPPVGPCSIPGIPTSLPCGVFVKSGATITKVLAQGDSGPAGIGGTISGLGTAPIMNGSGQVTVWAGIANGLSTQSIVRYTNGQLANVGSVGNPTPIGGTFSTFINSGGVEVPVINSPSDGVGQVALWGAVGGGGSGTEGIFSTQLPPAVIIPGPVAGATVPGTGGGTFGNAFDLAINNGGAAAFANTVTGGTASSGLFLFFAGQPVQDVALQGQAAPGGGNFSNFFSPAENNSGQIAARASTAGGPAQGLYLFFAGSAAKLAASGDPAAGGGTYSTFADPSINNLGTVADTATISGGSNGLFLFFAGSPATRLASIGDSAPGGGTYLFFAGSPAISDNGEVVQHATTSGGPGEGLYLFFAGSPTVKLVASGDSAPGGGTFSSFGNPMINANGEVVATANVSGGTSGLFLFFAGQPAIRLASVGDPALGGTFSGFSSPAINTNGLVAARATLSGGSATEGVFLFFGGSPAKIVAQGDPATSTNGTYGGTAPVFPFVAMNDSSQVVFVGNVVSGSTPQGVFLAFGPTPTSCASVPPWPFAAGDSDCDGFTTAVEDFVGTDPYTACGLSAWPPDFNSDTHVNLTDVVLLKPHFGTTAGPSSTTFSPNQFLAADMNASQTTLTANGSAIPNGRVIQIDSEQMKVTAGGGTTSLTVQRGYNGTTTATHLSGGGTNPIYSVAYDRRFDLDASNGINLTDVVKLKPFFGQNCIP